MEITKKQISHLLFFTKCGEKILQNARWLLQSGIPCRIRVPLIPGVNDTEENLRATAEFIAFYQLFHLINKVIHIQGLKTLKIIISILIFRSKFSIHKIIIK